MSLKIDVDDPNLVDVGFDVNGDFILEYNGSPFTGFEVSYYPGTTQIASEAEYQNGKLWGYYREYWPNGQLNQEYIKGNGGLDGPFKVWDENGNLIFDELFIDGVRQ